MPSRLTARSWLTSCMLLFCTIAFAQQKTVSGKITDAENAAVVGATVSVKGTNIATQSDANGMFSIGVPTDRNVLLVSSVGYESIEVPIGNQTSLSVSIKSTSTKLNEVVVVGYGTQRRKDLTGAVSSVNAAQIEKVPITRVDQALQGRAAGVQIINNDAAPGGNISVLIRGVGSLAVNGNNPLYIVDGYPATGGINNINPNDIASIDVLKDAAASIYGMRAANGVIIITTKRGNRSGMQVTVDAYNSIQSEPKKYDILNAQQWATLANEVADADPQHNFVELPIWRTPEKLTNIDWQDALYRMGLTQSYNVGLRGGNDKVQSATSLGYYDQKGIVEGSYFKRFTVGFNLDYTPNKWLRSTTTARYAYQNSNNPFGTNSLVQLTQLPPTMDSGNRLTALIKDANGNYGFYNPKSTYVAKYGNPLYNIETNEYENITNYFLANSALEVMIVDGLKIKTNAGVNINQYSGSYFQPEDNRLNQQYNLGGPTTNPAYNQHLNQTFEWVWENTLSYDKTFGLHSINFVGGISAQENTYTAMGGGGIPPNSVIRDLAQVTNLQLDANGNGKTVYSIASQFARLTYKFDDKYIISGIIRRDGSSKFDTGHQYGVFPSGSVAWRIKNESFLENSSWLHDLKLRGSYGVVGNEQPIAPFQYQALFSTGAAASSSGNLGYPFAKIYQRGIGQVQPANPELKWETDYLTDIGLDAAFMRGALTFTADWFNRKSQDFLLYMQASPQTGYPFLSQNVGTMVNKGLELAVNYNHTGGDFTYGAGLTFTHVQNKLTSLTSKNAGEYLPNYGGLRPAGNGWEEFSQTRVGGTIGEFFGYKSLGIFQTQAQIDALNAAAKAKDPNFQYYQKPLNTPGDRYFADVNGDGHVDPTDRVSLGSPLPDFYAGLNLDGAYKKWDFNLYFYGVSGNEIFNYQKSSLQSFQNRSFVGVENVSVEYYNNRWRPNNPSNTFSRATYNDDAIGSNVPSDAWVEDGSFIKLKNLMVGYTFGQSTLKKMSISKLRLYFSAQNLFTITGYSGADPEIGMQGANATQNGVDTGIYPSSRFFTFGINASF